MSFDFKTIGNTIPTHVEHHKSVIVDRVTEVGTNTILNPEPKPKPLRERAITWIKTACNNISNFFSRMFSPKKESVVETPPTQEQQTELDEITQTLQNQIPMYLNRTEFSEDYGVQQKLKEALDNCLASSKSELTTLIKIPQQDRKVTSEGLKILFSILKRNMKDSPEYNQIAQNYGYTHQGDLLIEDFVNSKVAEFSDEQKRKKLQESHARLTHSRPSSSQTGRRVNWGSISSERSYLGNGGAESQGYGHS